ncbi:MAG: ABC transporter ATP-binding protein [Betaproteobacteria bacterium]|nr:MAG: ABC transporter ATP-binding protein [Betaproteobacteria bacterium]
MNALTLSHISKRFGELVANDDISLSLDKGEVLALLGENGAGKSTLMNILFGHYVADSGSISVFGDVLPPGDPRAAIARGLGMVHQHFTLADNLSVLDNVMLGTESITRMRTSRAEALARLRSLAERFGLQINADALVRSLAVGEKQRVEILKALYRGARILILDEPTSVLTPQEATQLFATLRQLVAEGLSIIFISHKLDEVLAISHRVAVLRSGKLVFEGPTQGATKSSLARAMIGRDVESSGESRADGRRAISEKPTLLIEKISAQGEDARISLHDVSLALRAGEIVAIAGVSGNGQSLLADVLFGVERPIAGHVQLNGEPVALNASAMVKAGVARVPEDRQHVGSVGDLSVWENAILPRVSDARFSNMGLLKSNAARGYTRELVSKFDVRLSSIEHPIRKLSGGNIQKLLLGRELSESPTLIVAAQPTWGLDVGAVSFIHEELSRAAARGAAVLLISEDLDEVFALADRIAVMSRGRLGKALPTGHWTLESLGLAMAGEPSEHAGADNHAA